MQWSSIGIPSNQELENSKGVVHVKAYDKSDGTHVKEHYRSWPEGHGFIDNTYKKPDISIPLIHNYKIPDSASIPDNELPEINPSDLPQTSDGPLNFAPLPPVYAPEVATGLADGASTLVGGISTSGFSMGTVAGAVVGVLGVVAGIALITGAVIWAVKHHREVEKFVSKIWDGIQQSSAVMAEELEKNMPEIDKQLSMYPEGSKISKLLNEVKELNKGGFKVPDPNNSNNQVPYDEEHAKKVQRLKSISKELLAHARNLTSYGNNEQNKLINEAATTNNPDRYKELMSQISQNKAISSSQLDQIGRMEHYIDNNQFDNAAKEVRDNYSSTNASISNINISQNAQQQTLKGNVSKDYYKNVFNLGADYQLPFQENLWQTSQNSNGTYPYYEINSACGDLFRSNILNSVTDLVNYLASNNLQTSAELMRHAIEGLRDIPNTPDCQRIINPETKLLDLLKDYNLVDLVRYNNYENFPGIEYNSNSKVARQIINSPELQQFIKENHSKLINGGIKISSITFYSDLDLRLSIHKGWVLNAYIKNGTFYATIYDKYDFEWLTDKNISFSLLANDAAYILQELKQINNYYTIIDIIIPDINKTSNKK